MGQRHTPPVTRESVADQERRDQEVLRANKELAAYFKGRRTEREARAALKIIKAFVRDREHRDAKSRLPLPGAGPAKTPKKITHRKAASHTGEPSRRKPRRAPQRTRRDGVSAPLEPSANQESPQAPKPDERNGE